MLARERLEPTYIGNEIALPHARTDHVRRTVTATGRSNPGVFFETCNQTVRLIFVLGTPRSDPGIYLRLVGTLCRVLRDPAVCDALFRASDPGRFAAVLQENEPRT